MNKIAATIAVVATGVGGLVGTAPSASASVPSGCETVIYNTVGKARCWDGRTRVGIADCSVQRDIRKQVKGNNTWVYFECRHQIRSIKF